MTTTATPSLATLCPSWCEAANEHAEDLGSRHLMEVGTVVASTALPVRGTSERPDAFVWMSMTDDGQTLTEPRIWLAAENNPAFTPAEARRIALLLIKAADLADAVYAARPLDA